MRPAGYTPRFGPGAADNTNDTQARRDEEYRPYRSDSARPSYIQQQERRPAYNTEAPRSYEQQRPAYDQRPSYDTPRSYEQRPAYEAPAFGAQDNARSYAAPRPAYNAPARQPNGFYPQQDMTPSAAAVNDLLSAGECGDGSGVLELHPDGYGFLRSDTFLPSSRDIYVSMAQIRRFGLRTGDYVVGKTRPQREGDKYTAMLYITEVNGQQPDEAHDRVLFDELTPVYPTRRIDLETHDGQPLDDMRLTDLIAPLGFGQRGLVLCPLKLTRPPCWNTLPM